MEHFQLVVNLPPDEVMRRFAASIGAPSLKLINPFAGKDFIGRLNRYSFWFRERQRWHTNSFAPNCYGTVAANGTGSRIDVSIGRNFTIFFIFSGILLVAFTLITFLMVGIMAAMSQPDSQQLTVMIVIALAVPIPVIAFLGGLFFVGRQSGKSSGRRMSYFVQSLFRDASVHS